MDIGGSHEQPSEENDNENPEESLENTVKSMRSEERRMGGEVDTEEAKAVVEAIFEPGTEEGLESNSDA